MMVTAAGIVRHVQEILINPEHWSQKTYARDKEGKVVPVATAYTFCLLAALHRCKGDLGITVLEREYQQAFVTMRKVVKLRGFPSISKFNDDPETTHDAVIELLEIAEVQAQTNARS